MVYLLLLLAQVSGLNTFKGQVTDPSGAAIPGAVVRIAQAGGKEQRKNTDAAGSFEIRNLALGKYIVRIEKPGFAAYRIDDLPVSGATVFNIQMSLDAQAQVVNVQSEAEGVSTDPLSNASALVLTAEDLASFSDDPDALQDELMALAGPGAGPSGGQLFIDGFSGGKLPPKSSIREVRVNRNPYSAEYDRIGFGRIEIFTRPGTDKFRGELHFGFSDSSLNSRNPFSPTRAPFQSKLWGGRISGPLSKKASFSTDIEGRNVEENAIINATILDTQLVPTPFRQTVITPKTRFNITQRVDYALNTNNTLVARYSFNPTTADNRGVGDFALPSRAFDTKDTDHTPSLIGYSTARIQTLRKQSIEKFKAKQGENIGPYMDAVSPGYVASMGMRILEGRDFRDNDTENTALINKKFADKYFGGRAVSRHTGFGGNPETTTPIEIVGVYSDARYENLRDQVPIQMSIPV